VNVEKTKPKNIDDYIASYPSDVQIILEKIRKKIREAVPEAEETIKYEMPTFTLNGNLISFGAYKKHIGIYPSPSGSEAFNNELAEYKTEKSTLRFALDRPIPYDLISKVVKVRVNEHLANLEAKGK